MQPSDGSSGYHPPDQVSDWLTRAQSEFKVPRNSMVWQYHYENDGSPSPLTWLHTMYPQLSGITKVPVSAQKKEVVAKENENDAAECHFLGGGVFMKAFLLYFLVVCESSTFTDRIQIS